MLIEDKQNIETKEYVLVLKAKEKEKKKKKSVKVNLDFKNKTVRLLQHKINFNIPFTMYTKTTIKKRTNLISINYLFFNTLHSYLTVNKESIIKKFYIIIKIIFHLKLINVKWFELNNLILVSNTNIYLNLIKYKTKKLHLNKKNTNVFKLIFNTSTINLVNFNKVLLYFNTISKIKNNNTKYNFFMQKNLYMFFFNFNPLSVLNKTIKYSVLNLYIYKYIFSFLTTRKFNYLNWNLLKFFLIKFNKKNLNLLKFLLWKNNNIFKIEKFKQKKLKLKKFQEKKISFSSLYYIQLLEDKIDALTEIEDTANNIAKLENLKNILFTFLEQNNKKLEIRKYILMNPKKITDFTPLQRKSEFKKFLSEKISSGLISSDIKRFLINKVTKPNYKIIFKNVRTTFKRKTRFKRKPKIKKKNKYGILFNFRRKIKIRRLKKWKKPLSYNKFIGKRLSFNNSYFNYKYNQELISLLFGFKINTYFINALSLTRFELHMQLQEKKKILRNKRSSLLFINQLERDFVKRYKFVANYLQDFARVGFIALYTKDLTFLVKFIAFQIANLQKNRKETRLIKFIVKAIKVFSSQREEVIALKIQFKGRVNRWRRTKIITGKRGIIPFNSYQTRLEYATATSITRKGALGIRLWLYFDNSCSRRVEAGFKNYIKVNKILKYKKINNQIIK